MTRKYFLQMVLAWAVVMGGVCGTWVMARAADEPADVPAIKYSELIDLVSKSRGKVVLVNFWATWCAPCREEIADLKKLRETYGEDKLVILGVSVDTSPLALKSFMARQPFNYPIYRAQQDVLAAYSIMAIPRTVIYDTKGEKALSHEGFMDRDRMNKALAALFEEK